MRTPTASPGRGWRLINLPALAFLAGDRSKDFAGFYPGLGDEAITDHHHAQEGNPMSNNSQPICQQIYPIGGGYAVQYAVVADGDGLRTRRTWLPSRPPSMPAEMQFRAEQALVEFGAFLFSAMPGDTRARLATDGVLLEVNADGSS